LVTLISELCPPDSLNKLASLNRFCRKKVVEDSKEKYITILEYKYQKVCHILKNILKKLRNGEYIELSDIEKETNKDDIMRAGVFGVFRETFRSYQKANAGLEKLLSIKKN
jgi:hypothetical protein